MTDDDLIKRQRDGWEETALMYARDVDFWKSKLAKAVEDRKFILDERDRTFALMLARAEATEAKLAKAVDALRFYAPQTVGGITFLGGDDAGKRAAAALAELEGQ